MAITSQFAQQYLETGQHALLYGMDFDELLVRFFGTADIDTLEPERLSDGVDLLRVQFGLEQDDGRRFALWCLMYMLGVAPDLDKAFKHEAERDAARDFMDMIDDESEDR